MIIRGGENIYPAEIEQFLYHHPKIQEVEVLCNMWYIPVFKTQHLSCRNTITILIQKL